jgi:hypothetical protein
MGEPDVLAEDMRAFFDPCVRRGERGLLLTSKGRPRLLRCFGPTRLVSPKEVAMTRLPPGDHYLRQFWA